MQNKKLLNTIGVVILVVCSLAIGFTAGKLTPKIQFGKSQYTITGDTSKDKGDINFNLFWNIWDTLETGYVDESKVDLKQMFYGSIKGMVESLDDPATLFLDPDETKAFDEGNAGKLFEGIGAELGYENGQIVIIAPIDGSPAMEAGLKAGDIIFKVDGEDIKPSESIFDVVLRIRGEAGTKVVLTVLHKGALKVEEIEITRGEITIPSIEVRDVEGQSKLKILDIGRFTDESLFAWNKNWDEAVQEVLTDGAKGLILDLRGNPGGYFNAAVYAAEDFLKVGDVVAKQEDRAAKTTVYKVERKGELLEIPVVVLVDSSSASASEILAGALQKNDRTKIVGEVSYGKGTAQSIIPLSDGSSLHLTTLRWLLPNGQWLNRENAIKPDYVVEFSEEDFLKGKDNQLDKAIELLNKEIN